MNIEKKNDILSKAYKDSQAMISLADSKANISLTIQSLLITLTLGFSIVSNLFEKIKSLVETNYPFVVFFISFMFVLIGVSIIGIVTTILVFKPRESKEVSERNRKGFFYFGHVSKYESSDEYLAKIQELSEEDLMEEYSRQIYQLSLIASDKFKYVRFSVYFLIINLSLSLVFLIVNSFVNLV